MEMIQTILVPVDGSTHANAAIDWAGDLAVKFQAKLIILHVVSAGRREAFPEELRDYAKLERADLAGWDLVESMAGQLVLSAEQRARARGAVAVETVIEPGNAAKVILAQASRRGADLIVMGRRGLGALPGLVLGSVSSKVLQLADCACLTVK